MTTGETAVSAATAMPDGAPTPRVRRRFFAPVGWINRIRRAFLLLNLILIVVLIQLTSTSAAVDETARMASVAALTWLGFRWLREYVVPSRSAFWDCADGIALFGAGMAITSLESASGMLYLSLLYSSLCFRSLSYRWQRVTIGFLVYMIVVLGVTLMAQQLAVAEPVSPIGPTHFPAFAAVALVAHLLVLAIRQREHESAHKDRIADAAVALANADQADEIATTARDAVHAILAPLVPSTVAVVSFSAMPPSSGHAANERAEWINVDPERVSVDDMKRLATGEVVELAPADAALVLADDTGSASRRTIAFPLRTARQLAGLIVIATNDRLDRQTLGDVEDLARHISDALARAQQRWALERQELAYRELVHHVSDAITVIDADLKIQFLSPVAERLFGHDQEQLIGLSIHDLAHPDDRAILVAFLEELSDGGADAAIESAEWRLRRGDESWLEVETSGANLLDRSAIQGLVLSCRDITQRKALELQLVHRAFHDPLTELPNRTMFLEQLTSGLARPLSRSITHGVMFLDLDRFKVINDSLGHEAGDQLLQAVASRLREAVRGSDLVARLGGDEFAILLPDLIDDVPAVQIAERILQRMQEPISLSGHEVIVTPSIGIAVGAALRHRPEDLIRNADVAMYAAKQQGRACYMLHHDDLVSYTVERLDFESELRQALAQQQIDVYYQPLVALKTGQVHELEALVRWRHPSRGLLAPDEFIALAEETGLIVPIGRHVLQEACHHVQLWKQHAGHDTLQLSVNLSARQIQHPTIVPDVVAALESSGLHPGDLKLEITESAAMIDISAAVETLNELKRLGVQLAIDDFGMGYSALSSLKHFPVDALKIDRSFIAGLDQIASDTAIVSAVIAFARALDLNVTAEGIETAAQLRRLHSLGCDQGQGFLIAAPMETRHVPLMLTQGLHAKGQEVEAEAVTA